MLHCTRSAAQLCGGCRGSVSIRAAPQAQTGAQRALQGLWRGRRRRACLHQPLFWPCSPHQRTGGAVSSACLICCALQSQITSSSSLWSRSSQLCTTICLLQTHCCGSGINTHRTVPATAPMRAATCQIKLRLVACATQASADSGKLSRGIGRDRTQSYATERAAKGETALRRSQSLGRTFSAGEQ